MPLHVAIIPDGNRRWAKERSLLPWKGHERSAETFESLLNFCRDETPVNVLTIWVFSTENWKRSPEEVKQLMSMFEKYLRTKLDDFHRNKTRLLHSGRRDRLSPGLLSALDAAAEATAEYDAFTLHIALDYGGKDEIVRAVARLKNANPTEEDIRAALDQPNLPDIDLVVRTSGERRTSNFFLWQTAYAEWYFTDAYFPDFGPENLKQALDDYSARKRRFGG